MLDFVTLYINNIIINNNYNNFDKILLEQNKNKTQQALRSQTDRATWWT